MKSPDQVAARHFQKVTGRQSCRAPTATIPSRGSIQLRIRVRGRAGEMLRGLPPVLRGRVVAEVLAARGEVGLMELARAVDARATALAAASLQLRRVGVNLNQLVHILHRGGTAAPAALDEVLEEVNVCLKRLQPSAN